MTKGNATIPVCLEIGSKRVFASAVDWPGWSRSARDETGALQALLEYSPRYARVLRSTDLGFWAPSDQAALRVTERLRGTTTTDFGAPGVPPKADARPLRAADLERYQTLLTACWRYLDTAAKKAHGKSLRKGPRGGGRDLDAILRHVHEAEGAYLGALGWKPPREASDDVAAMRLSALEGLTVSARGEIPARGPRGGVRWTAHYFVRRVAWHILDHAWEIEDRIE